MSDDFSPSTHHVDGSDQTESTTLEPQVVQSAELELGGGAAKRFALGIAILAVLGGAIFAAFTLLNNQENTPGESASSFMEALAAEDLLGLTESLLPGERRVIAEPLFEWLDEVERLGILSEVDRNSLQGLNLDFSDLVYDTEELADDLAWVTISGATSSSVRPEDLPLGDLLRRYLPEGYVEDLPSEVTEDSDLDEDFGFALVKENGTWYVSLLHTVAEAARRESGLEFSDQQLLNEPQGGETPAEALELFTLSAAALDLRGMLDVMDPDETAAFRRYTPLFLPDWDTTLADLRSEMTAAGFVYRVDEVTTASAGEGNDIVAWVTDIPKFSFDIDAPGFGAIAAERDGDCMKVNIDDTAAQFIDLLLGSPGIDYSLLDGQTCLNELDGSSFEGLELQDNPYGDLSDFDAFKDVIVIGPIIDHFSTMQFAEAPQLEFQIVEQHGRYFVSLSGSYNRWYLSAVRLLDESLLIAVGDDIKEIVEDPEAALIALLPLLESLDPTGVLLASMTGVSSTSGSTSSGESGGIDYSIGADILASYADEPGMLIVWDYDVEYVSQLIENLYGPGIVTGSLTGAELRAYFLAAFGPEGDFGMSDDEFPSGIQITEIDVDALIEIFNWDEILELYSVAELGIAVD